MVKGPYRICPPNFFLSHLSVSHSPLLSLASFTLATLIFLKCEHGRYGINIFNINILRINALDKYLLNEWEYYFLKAEYFSSVNKDERGPIIFLFLSKNPNTQIEFLLFTCLF